MVDTTADEGAGPPAAPDKAVRIATTEREAADWALVLDAGGIPYRLEATAEGWQTLVTTADEPAATAALAAYDAEQRERAGAPERPPPEVGWGHSGTLVGALLVAFFLITGPRGGANPVPWFAAGSADAAALVGGEPWRAITALTLHADVAHVVGNAVACLIFVTAVCRWLGFGLGILLVLLAGAAGNVATAVFYASRHVSVGASTATFGALGILAGLQLVRRWRIPGGRRKAWVAVGASLAIFAMLGVGERSDVVAHLAGLVAGIAAGVAAGQIARLPGATVQRALGGATAALIAGAWAAALLAS